MGTHAGNDLPQGMAFSCIHFAILAFDSKVLRNVKREVAHAWSSFHALVAGDTVVAQKLSHSEMDTDQSWLAFVDVR
jgi:hypothetical protein